MKLFNIPKNVETRWASCENLNAEKGGGGKEGGGRKGHAYKAEIAPGEVFTMAHQEEGCGIVRRMWITIPNRDKTGMLGFVIRMYWDGEEKPAVEVPLGDFFCQPWGIPTKFENAWFDTSVGRSFVCRIPMPFRKGFKITITNETDAPSHHLFYDVNWTINDDLSENAAYFHSHYRREHKTTLKKDFEILPKTIGEGRFLGCTLGAIANQNLHGLESTEMLIITPRVFWEQAQALASFHMENDGMDCVVADINEIYNEFSTGKVDPTALRDMIRMLYLRSQGQLKYVLLLGKGTHDVISFKTGYGKSRNPHCFKKSSEKRNLGS